MEEVQEEVAGRGLQERDWTDVWSSALTRGNVK